MGRKTQHLNLLKLTSEKRRVIDAEDSVFLRKNFVVGNNLS